MLACSALLATSCLQAADKYALVVGVEKYDPGQLPSLQFAEEDAVEIGKALEQLGFDVVSMTDQTDIPERKPIYPDDILVQLRRRLRDRQPSDTIVVSLSGHGLQFKDDPKDEFGEKETYFCPQRAKVSDKRTLLPMSAVINELAQCKAGKKLLLIDACRDETSPSELREKSVEMLLEPAGGIRKSIPDGVVAFYSCRQRETSFELKKLGHSIFTFHVLKYLRGEADRSRYPSGQVDLNELYAYASSATRNYVDSQFNKDQQPELVIPNKSLKTWELGKLSENAFGVTSAVGIKLLRIPSGRFQMGSRDSPEQVAYAFAGEKPGSFRNEHPRRQIEISQDFYMGAHEVTRGQFKQFVKERGYRTDLERGVQKANPTGLEEIGAAKTWLNSGFVGISDDHPITLVTLNDARAFCNWLSIKEGRIVRLPTQAEWEYACRAGSDSTYWTGDDPMSLIGAANVPCGQGEETVTTLRWYTGDPKQHNNGWAKIAAPLGSRVTFGVNQQSGLWEYEINTRGGSSPNSVTLDNRGNQSLDYSPPQFQGRKLTQFNTIEYSEGRETRGYTLSGLPNKSAVVGVSIPEEFG